MTPLPAVIWLFCADGLPLDEVKKTPPPLLEKQGVTPVGLPNKAHVWRVVNVIRMGLPPYEEHGEKLYRLEGPDCLTLRKGEELVLSRPGESALHFGRLQVIVVRADHVLTKLLPGGDTYPIKGDEAQKSPSLQALPEVAHKPVVATLPAPGGAPTLVPKQPAPMPVPPVSAPAPATLKLRKERHRGTILFSRGSAKLSPGAYQKLSLWQESWGPGGVWVLLRPANGLPALINQMRCDGIKQSLANLGILQVEVRDIPAEPTSKYDSVYVVLEEESM